MNKPAGWDEMQSYTGEAKTLPAGLYICKIIDAKEVTSGQGNRQLKIAFDIDEGEYRHHYATLFSAQSLRDANVKWKGVYYQNVDGKSVPFFKGLIENIENSNPGYKWDWNESGLKGKRFGGVFGREEFRTENGTAWVTKLKSIRTIERLKNAVVPEDKPIINANTRPGTGFSEVGFTDFEPSDDDLPF